MRKLHRNQAISQLLGILENLLSHVHIHKFISSHKAGKHIFSYVHTHTHTQVRGDDDAPSDEGRAIYRTEQEAQKPFNIDKM